MAFVCLKIDLNKVCNSVCFFILELLETSLQASPLERQINSYTYSGATVVLEMIYPISGLLLFILCRIKGIHHIADC